MSTDNEIHNSRAENEVFNSRILNYPRELVWRAWEEPEHLTNWFGPKGFTSTFHEFNFREDGDWKFIFHGPDGKNWDNHNCFVEIKRFERIVFDHLSKPHIFRAEVTFEDMGEKTKVNFRQIHENPVSDDFRKFLLEANEQNFDRLEAELKRLPACLPAGRHDGKTKMKKAVLFIILPLLFQSAFAAEAPAKFKHVQTQYIVALGDANANSGTGAEAWGLWDKDPGPRGCSLKNYKQLAKTGVAPAQWPFDKKDWWLEEHGLIMEKPTFPLKPGKYVVTGGREVTTILTIDSKDEKGGQNWHLGNGAKLYDVTHLPCHAARYMPTQDNVSCSPDTVEKAAFPVASGMTMPTVKGCDKKDYAVLFVVGVARE